MKRLVANHMFVVLLVGLWLIAAHSFALQSDYDFLLSMDSENQNENDPWRYMVEINDTGIDDEQKFHQVFSAQKYSLLADYDFFAIDYETDSFEEYDAGMIQYDTSYFFNSWYLSSVFDYSTEQLRPIESDLVLEDSRWGVAGYLYYVTGNADTVWQWGIGGRWVNLKSENRAIFENSEENQYFLPGLKLSLQHNTGAWIQDMFFLYEWSAASIANTKDISTQTQRERIFFDTVAIFELAADYDNSFQLLSGGHQLQYDINQTQNARFSLSGQTSFGDPVIRSFQGSVGGLYSVRGYDDYVLSGDQVIEASLSYYWAPGLLVGLHPSVSSWVYVFYDWANVKRTAIALTLYTQSERLLLARTVPSDERSLASAGAGIELFYQGNSTLNLVWALALEEDGVETSAGDSRIHFYIRINF